ncbi:MAG TPA: VOC family protein [Methanofastidiosum sp.]|nr:VOC family protein [Methanofastidiosum sp.]
MPFDDIHHIGIVVDSIKEYLKNNVADLSGITEIVEDPIQKAKICFIGSSGFSTIELIEPLDESSPTYSFLRNKGGIHHICYRCDNLDEVKKRCEDKKALIVMDSVPAKAIGNCRILFVYTKNKELVEFVEK